MNRNYIGKNIQDWTKKNLDSNLKSFDKLIKEMTDEKEKIYEGGGLIAIQ